MALQAMGKVSLMQSTMTAQLVIDALSLTGLASRKELLMPLRSP
jgi:hypothetical protein